MSADINPLTLGLQDVGRDNFNFTKEYQGKCTQKNKGIVWDLYKRYEEKKNQQDATIRCLLLTSISTCFEHHYAHLQENKEPVTAFGVLFCFCWVWLVAVVGRCLEGSEH